jgi:hypothetical protein
MMPENPSRTLHTVASAKLSSQMRFEHFEHYVLAIHFSLFKIYSLELSSEDCP